MDDKDNLYFSFDDQEEPEQEQEVKAEEGQNRTFLIGAIVLAAVFVLGICAVVGYLFFGQQLFGQQVAQGPSENELTNNYMQTQLAATETSSFLTGSAPTAVMTNTTAPKPSMTPTSSVGETTPENGAEETEEGTPGTGEPDLTVTKGLAGVPTTAAPVTGTPGTAQPAAGGAGTTTVVPTKATSSIIEVTPLGNGATPTRIVSGVGGSATSSIIEVTGDGQGGGVGGTPTGQGGPVVPGATPTIPTTGFGSGAGLAGAGLLAMLLVVVVVVVRKIRLNQ